MPESAFRLHGACDSGYFDEISAATVAICHFYLEDLGQHLGPRMVGHFDSPNSLRLGHETCRVGTDECPGSGLL